MLLKLSNIEATGEYGHIPHNVTQLTEILTVVYILIQNVYKPHSVLHKRIYQYLQVVMFLFLIKHVYLFLYNTTHSKAIVNAASNITYRPLIEADDTDR